MPSHFGLSIRFLAPAFHGRRDRGEPEWPPSPLRVLQSLVAAAAARHREDLLTSHARSALQWLEKQVAPTVVAPAGLTASGYRLSVPNNAMDIVAKAWCRGNDSYSGDANPATHRTMKTVRPTHLLGGDAVHYLWPLAEPISDEVRGHVEVLSDIARSVVVLGWGVDMVVGHCAIVSDENADALLGERWLPSGAAAGDGLRVPVQGTLADLNGRHTGFLNRLGSDGLTFTAPPSLSVFDTVRYRRATEPPLLPVAAFSLLRLDAGGFRAFDTARRALTVAGMVRHAAKLAAEHAGWPEQKVCAFILGHRESKDIGEHVAVGPSRFAYLPLPSIEGRGEGSARVVGSVRRVILSSFGEGCEAEVAWARRALSGQELIDEDKKQAVAILSLLPINEKIVRHYTRPSASWATVTPVVLPGYDDPAHYRRRLERGTSAEEQKQLLHRLDDRIDGLLRKAITQAGLSQVLADHAELEWRKVGFWPGADVADRYGVPDHLRRFPRFHVRLNWRDAHDIPLQVRGPVCIGGGRFFGLGLFAALTS
jgi:CRISPR-associated protein Csb2